METQNRLSNMKQKASSFFKRLMIILILISIVGAVGYYLWCTQTYSEGNRAGYLVKISRKGYVFKTYEGQLNLNPMGMGIGNAATGGSIWEFSVANDETFTQLQEFEGKQVSLHYREVIKNFPWQGDTKYFVDKVEVVER